MSRERNIAELEQQQFGLVSVTQLKELGVSRFATYRRVNDDRHDRVRRGVLANPSVAVTFEQRLLAAVLASGPTGFASHEAAARLWGLPLPMAAPVEVTTDMKRRPRMKGVRLHRSGLISEDDVVVINGIRCSTPDRTITDISARYDLKVLGRIVDDALRRKLTTLAQLAETSERLKSAPGRSRRKMRTVILRRDDGVAERESVLEDFVFEALRRFGLPTPVAQHRVRVAGKDRRIDFCYLERPVALEPKGFGPHAPRSLSDADALRGNELRLAGYFVLDFTSAFTDWQIADQVAQALGLARPRMPKRPLTFLDWGRRRDRLVTSVRTAAPKRPNA